jgi:DNA integrity scanning protein DisA with diadenylate cyclase activity
MVNFFRAKMAQMFQPSRQATPNLDIIINEILDAVIELSQTRTGALLILETNAPTEERNFPFPGVKLDALVSKSCYKRSFNQQLACTTGLF